MSCLLLVLAACIVPARADVVIQGALYCLDDKSGPQRAEGQLCSERNHHYALADSSGNLFELVRGQIAEALYADPRLHQRLLRLSLNPRPDGRFDVLKVQSVIDGVVHDIYYFCDVCNVRGFAPGPCDCCQNPYEFIEKPAP